MKKIYDVIIIGGSFSGLSAALCLGRSLRSTLVISKGNSRNFIAEGAHNVLGNEGIKPTKLLKKAKKEIETYKEYVQQLDDYVISLTSKKKEKEIGFLVKTQGEKEFECKRVILATGVSEVFPKIKGIEELWGKLIFHCPYCHGYEVKFKKLAVYTEFGPMISKYPVIVKNWTQDLTMLTNDLKLEENVEDDLKKNRGIKIEKRKIKEFKENKKGKLVIEFDDGKSEEFDGLFLASLYKQRAEFLKEFNFEMDKIFKLTLEVDSSYKTSVPGIYAVGDMSSPFHTVVRAIASGMQAAAMLNHELVFD